jgi:hypothetical protein
MPERIQEYRRQRDNPPPLGEPSDDRRYVIAVNQKGGVFAVAFKDKWIPTHAVGPLTGEQLTVSPHEHDWSNPLDVRTWNAAMLVPVSEQHRQKMIKGTSRLLKR